MFKNRLSYNILWILSTLLIVFIDQITKYITVQKMHLYDEIPVIKGFFHLLYVRNPGAGLGMFANSRWVFITFTFVVIIIAIILLVVDFFKNTFANVSIIFILGGGIGNMIDRLVLGEVVDFFQFQIKYFDFIFNVADIFVTFGTIMFVIYYIFWHDKVAES